MSIANKLTQLTTIRASMREKLIAKGIDAETHNFADFPNDVEDIQTGTQFTKIEPIFADNINVSIEVNLI